MSDNDWDVLGDYAQGTDAPQRATAAALDRMDGARTIVLVEGVSDQIAVEALAERLGRDLTAENAVVVPIGGAQAARKFVDQLGDSGARLLGLCDHNEREFFHTALPEDDVFVCDPDLEVELFDALEPAEIEAAMEAEGELGSFRTFQKQREWRDRPYADQLRRWFSAGYRRKSRYARRFVLTTPVDRLPAPLLSLLDRI